MTLLAARDLSVTPPGTATPAVMGFSVEIGRGEWIGVNGPNGCGKTSLLLGLAGLWPADGDLRLDGRPFGAAAEPDLRRGVAAILQDPSSQLLQPTVFDELAFAARNLGASEAEVRSRVAVWSGCFRLSCDLERDPTRLSAGRQQLVLVAAALVAEPRLLLADEATAHMDDEARELVLGVLRERVANGLGVFWVTQNRLESKEFHRTITLGDPVSPRRPPVGVAGSNRSGPRVIIRVAPISSDPTAPSAPGPSVSTRTPLEIAVPMNGIVAITGPNGVGKSVILMAAAGVEHLDQVSLEWKGRADPPPIAALQFPDLQIFQDQVSDEMAFASVARGVPPEAAMSRVRSLLEELGIPAEAFLAKRAWGLGAGEKRIMEVAAAIAAPASLYLLDEPTAGLDPERRAVLGELIARESGRGAFLLASQDRKWLEELGCPVVEIGPVETARTPRGRARPAGQVWPALALTLPSADC